MHGAEYMAATVTIKFDLDGSGVATGARVVNTAVDGVADNATRAFGKARQGVQSISRELANARVGILSFIGASKAMSLVQDVGRLADEYRRIGASLSIATGGAIGFAQAQSGIFSVAQRTRSSLSDTADLIQRLTTGLQGLGANATTAFDASTQLAVTIQQAMELSGASATQASSGIETLTTALARGGLKAGDFNRLLRQAPALANAIANGMGISIDKLTHMGAQGVISTSDVLRALDRASADVAAKANALPNTIGEAWVSDGTDYDVDTDWTDAATDPTVVNASGSSQIFGVIGVPYRELTFSLLADGETVVYGGANDPDVLAARIDRGQTCLFVPRYLDASGAFSADLLHRSARLARATNLPGRTHVSGPVFGSNKFTVREVPVPA